MIVDIIFSTSLIFSGFILGVVSMMGLDKKKDKETLRKEDRGYSHLKNRGHLNVDDFDKLNIAYQIKYSDSDLRAKSVDDKI